MSSVDRDPQAMKKFAKEWDDYSAAINSLTTKMEICCDSASLVLQDEASERMIRKIRVFSEEIRKTVAQGEQPVRELERSAKKLEELDNIR